MDEDFHGLEEVGEEQTQVFWSVESVRLQRLLLQHYSYLPLYCSVLTSVSRLVCCFRQRIAEISPNLIKKCISISFKFNIFSGNIFNWIKIIALPYQKWAGLMYLVIKKIYVFYRRRFCYRWGSSAGKSCPTKALPKYVLSSSYYS